ncbi:hypothetical protein BLL38_07120 [Pseudomonas gessardii]|nr:hypothetical protein BLL38_07120 [Pseudomonas gessardii]
MRKICKSSCSSESDISFRYHSPSGDIVTAGVYRRMSRQIYGSANMPEQLWAHAQDLLTEATMAGIENPVIVGAIPFSKTSFPELFIPLSYSRDFVRRDTKTSKKLNLKSGSSPLSLDGSFISAVAEALRKISNRELDKVVLSRTLDLKVELQDSGHTIVDRLLRLYPQAYNFYLPLDKDHYWLGASPELLVRRQGASVESFPLAGSAARSSQPDQDRHAAQALFDSQKDRREHQFVVDEIARLLTPVSEPMRVPPPPLLVPAGPLWHLGTPISATLKAPWPSAMELAARLHPTPAVCGYPTQSAWELIDRLEPHARGLYAGMVGWTDAQGNGEWAVTIRCAQYHAGTLRLFAGAGIVADSSVESECQETSTKFSTLLRALGITDEACA